MRLDAIARPLLKPPLLALAAALIAAAPSSSAQVYKWVDERGVVNYGNNPPNEVRGSKRATRVEDNLSVYTPDEPLLDATKRGRERSAQPAPAGGSVPQTLARPAAPATAVPPAMANAPCVSGFEPSCTGSVYYGAPVVQGHGHGPRLNQPELPPGAIAGNVNSGSGYTPGLSTQPPPVSETTGRRLTPSASFTLKDIDERGRGRR
jgi:Domain of unknown function (DUF4124)